MSRTRNASCNSNIALCCFKYSRCFKLGFIRSLLVSSKTNGASCSKAGRYLGKESMNPSWSKEINPLSNKRSKFGVKSNPLFASRRYAPVMHFAHRSMWDANKKAESLKPVTSQHLARANTPIRNLPWPTRAKPNCIFSVLLISVFASISCMTSASPSL